MLNGIPAILSPNLMKLIMEMGHGDELVLADGNFPAVSNAARLVRCDGHGVAGILDALLKFFPLDAYVDAPAGIMQVVEGDDTQPEIWNTYREILCRHEPEWKEFEFIERFEFYERARKAFGVVATSESALYANIILKKGVVTA